MYLNPRLKENGNTMNRIHQRPLRPTTSVATKISELMQMTKVTSRLVPTILAAQATPTRVAVVHVTRMQAKEAAAPPAANPEKRPSVSEMLTAHTTRETVTLNKKPHRKFAGDSTSTC